MIKLRVFVSSVQKELADEVAGDFKLFQKLHLVKQMGRGRSVFYVLDTVPNR